MDNYTFIKTRTDSLLSNIRDKADALSQRHDDLLQRERDLMDENNINEMNQHEIININAGGTIFTAKRGTLSFIQGSRLQVIFSGRWENKLLRDNKGRVFLDVDPYYFGKLLDRLYIYKLLKNNNDDTVDEIVQVPKLQPNEQENFEIYWNFFFGVAEKVTTFKSNQTSASTTNTSLVDQDGYVAAADSVKREAEELQSLEKHLNQMDLNIGESFVDFFTSNIKNTTNHNTPGSSEVMNLYLHDGQIISVKQSTLCLIEDSKFAENFSDKDWLEQHTFDNDDDIKAILIEQPSNMLIAMINQLRLKSIVMPEQDLPSVAFGTVEDKAIFERLVHYQFSSGTEVFFGNTKLLDSSIITDRAECNQITEWLESVGKTGVPTPLYKASVDGWETADFHRKCDDKGATMTVVKTKEGYVFGGYADKSWSTSNNYISSDEAFLFSLKCHANVTAVKMEIKSGCEQYATRSSTSYGPVFGEGDDLWFGYQDDMRRGWTTNLGHTYKLPDGHSNTFLSGKTGANDFFKIEEVEVFQV